jgi:hypothetical protein
MFGNSGLFVTSYGFISVKKFAAFFHGNLSLTSSG